MSYNTTLKTLFAALHGSLPYEYDEKYINGTHASILVTKNDSDHIAYITANTPDDNGVFDVTPYDDIHDDDPIETVIWDANDPNFNLIDLITYIEKSL